ncbi:HNH endonuclease signature motif containing protein [Rhizocola hellebori]|uniref:HNH endonuclease signature motif containing protein n=1 Tax=Rhizocola hellebori TaxID=1392758 RepID=UPI001942CCD7|nr:HNH endonuclease signature motif containing protein [Rhizocola hellebori]
MTAWIRARDRTCRAPGCRIPARACHLDHTTNYAHGGPTTHDDLGPLCARHHIMKHEGGWQLRQTRPGHFIWISPTGRIYHIKPEPP